MFYFLYKIAYDPESIFSFFRLFFYISSRSIFASITAFLVVLVTARWVINELYRRGYRDRGRDYDVYGSATKSGTPLMGGIIIFMGAMASVLLWCNLTDRFILLLLAASVWFFACGIVDDTMKIKSGSSDSGLTKIQKILLQSLFGVVLGILILWTDFSPIPAPLRTKLYLPFYKYPILDLGIIYLLVIWVTVTYAANAVNFADGLDGLAIVPGLFVISVYGIFAYVLGNVKLSDYFLFYFAEKGGESIHLMSGEVTVFSAALVGSCLGFLWYNAYPADVFMGDTGSLYLGGVIGTIAVLLKQEVLMLIIGGVFLAEILSVVIQDWIGIKLIGRRILYRAPIHHTFQHRGLAETKIVVRFWIISGILALIGLASLKVR